MSEGKQTRNALLAVAAALVFLGVSLFAANALKGPSPESVKNSQSELREFVKASKAEIEDKITWYCEFVDNRKWRVIQAMIRESIHESTGAKKLHISGIPPKVLRHLIKIHLAAKRRRYKQAAPVPCAGLFPSP